MMLKKLCHSVSRFEPPPPPPPPPFPTSSNKLALELVVFVRGRRSKNRGHLVRAAGWGFLFSFRNVTRLLAGFWIGEEDSNLITNQGTSLNYKSAIGMELDSPLQHQGTQIPNLAYHIRKARAQASKK